MPELVPIADGLLVHEETVRFYGATIQTRMSVIPLAGGDLFVHSPTPLTSAMRRELDALGRVAHVVSPNKIHNQGLSSYAEAWPDARLYASPGLPERRMDLIFHAVLGDAPEPAWADVLDQATTKGNSFFSEVIFLHESSGTLIVADLVENIGGETVTWAGRILAKAFGVYHRCWASPEFRLYTHDPKAARKSFERILEWDFDRILLAHGDLISEDAKAVFADVANRLVEEVSLRSRRRQHFYDWMASKQ